MRTNGIWIGLVIVITISIGGIYAHQWRQGEHADTWKSRHQFMSIMRSAALAYIREEAVCPSSLMDVRNRYDDDLGRMDLDYLGYIGLSPSVWSVKVSCPKQDDLNRSGVTADNVLFKVNFPDGEAIAFQDGGIFINER